MQFRNWAFDLGLLSSTSFPIPVVSIGNIRVGGTGKTPMTIYLINLLKTNYKVAVLSRGYGRRTTGYLEVELQHEVEEVGDEVLMMKKKNPDIIVSVCEDRVAGVKRLLQEHPEVSLVLLDDAFQHRYIKPYLNLVLSTVQHPYYKDLPFPSGRLREFPWAYKRADAMIFTKFSSDFHEKVPERILKRKPSFKTAFEYNFPEVEEVYGFSGLAHNAVFKDELNRRYKLKGFRSFPDHHQYTELDLVDLRTAAGEGVPLLCTSKDKVKVEEFDDAEDVLAVEIEVAWQEREKFEDWLLTKLKKFES